MFEKALLGLVTLGSPPTEYVKIVFLFCWALRFSLARFIPQISI